MFVFWGDGSREAMALVESIRVRSTENFNWTFIFILAVVFYVYWTEIHNKNTEAVVGLERVDDVHTADRRLLGAFDNVLAGGHNIFQDAAARPDKTLFREKRQGRDQLQAGRRARNGAAVRAVRIVPRGNQ